MFVSLLKKAPLFSKAEKIKDLYFEKLDTIISAVASLAANDTAVLQALVHVIESAREDHLASERQLTELTRRLAAVEATLDGLRKSLPPASSAHADEAKPRKADVELVK